MKWIHMFILIFLVAANSQVFINEIDYDQPNNDTEEFIELIGPDGMDLTNYTIELVDGGPGIVYITIDLSGFSIPNDNVNGNGFFVIGPASGVSNVDYTPNGWVRGRFQDGNPDGILLKLNGVVVDGFSYEGIIPTNSDFTAGMAITAEENDNSPNLSIGRIDLGFSSANQDQYFAASANTPSPGEVNVAHGQSDQSLPVQLSSFTARAGDRIVTLRWVTESEKDNVGFEIMRSDEKDGNYLLLSSYVNNDVLKGQLNSSQQTIYQFTDQLVGNDITYWYRLVDVDLNGLKIFHGPISATPHALGNDIVNTTSGNFPQNFALQQNYPNPFNPRTTLGFGIPQLSSGSVDATLYIYNSLGQQVKVLYQGKIAAGTYTVEWDGTSESGLPLPSGIYYASLRADYFIKTIKMMYLK
jgi:hypothetical protein